MVETLIDAIFTQAAADIFNSPVGEDAVYTPAGGTAVPCRIVVNRDVLLQPDGMNAQVIGRGTTIESILEDLGQEPNRGDVFTVGAETFTVGSIERNDGVTVEAVVT